MLCIDVDKGKVSQQDDFYPLAERATKKGWLMLQLEANYNAQWSAPEALAKMLWDLRLHKGYTLLIELIFWRSIWILST